MREDPDITTIAHAVLEQCARTPDAVAIVDGVGQLTYAELADAALSGGAWLVAQGFARFDRAALWAPNGREWILAALSVHIAGGTLVPLNTRLSADEAQTLITRSGADVVFTTTDFLGTDFTSRLSGLGADAAPRHVIVLSGPVSEGQVDWSAVVEATQPESSALSARLSELVGSDPSDIMFSSGTTGIPKGVVLENEQNLRAIAGFGSAMGITATDCYLGINPFSHSFGYKHGWLVTLLAGGRFYPVPVFNGDEAFRIVIDHQVTVLAGPATIYQDLLDAQARTGEKVTSVRIANIGSTPSPGELFAEVVDRLGVPQLSAGYGLTETCGITTITRLGSDAQTVATTCGPPIDGMEVVVVDKNGTELSTGEVGEVLIRGPIVARTYLETPGGDPAKKPGTDADGWLHTGDLALFDERGYISLRGRTDDMISVAGFNVYPGEIEIVLRQHPNVTSVAVVGAPDERLGEVPIAFVTVASPTVDPEALRAWAGERLATFRRPQRVVVVGELPYTASRKVHSAELRRMAAELSG